MEIESKNVKNKFIITRVYGAYYEIYNSEIGLKRAVLKGKLRLENHGERHPFVVGDYVEVNQDGQDFIISNKLERKTVLVRKSDIGDTHVLCANVDIVAIIASFDDPETKDGFIDRSIAACSKSNATPIIVFTKKDLVNDEYIQEKLDKYRNLGYTVFSVSCIESDLDGLEGFLKDKITYLVGNSGVGKSSILNLLVKKDIQKINEVSISSKKGKHTTTNSSGIIADTNTIFIDSPGIKEWGLLHLTKIEILESYPELLKHKEKCIEPDCCNSSSNCKMMEVLESESMDAERQKSMLAMLDGIDTPYRVRTGNYLSGKLKKKKNTEWDKKRHNKNYNYEDD